MIRRHRHYSAWLGILGIAFAQVAVTAHACMTGAPVQASAARAVAMAHEGHCGGAQGATTPDVVPVAPIANACEVQCTDGTLSAVTADVPPVTLAILPVAPAPVTVMVDVRELDRSILAATSAAPPPLLQFCRLLN